MASILDGSPGRLAGDGSEALCAGMGGNGMDPCTGLTASSEARIREHVGERERAASRPVLKCGVRAIVVGHS